MAPFHLSSESTETAYKALQRTGAAVTPAAFDEFEITTFARTHGDRLRPFTEELRVIAPDFDIFPHPSGEPVYDLLCAYLDPQLDRLAEITAKTEAQQDAP